MKRVLLGLALTWVMGCDDPAPQRPPSLTQQSNADEATEMATEMRAATMSVRSAPAKVPADDVDRLAALQAEAYGGGGGGGGMRRDRHPFSEYLQERSENLSEEEARRVVQGLLSAAQSEAPEPCARIFAMIDQAGAPLDEAGRAEVRQRCRTMPRGVTACLKPMSERSPYERRSCRRFLRRPGEEDIPDLLGNDGPVRRP